MYFVVIYIIFPYIFYITDKIEHLCTMTFQSEQHLISQHQIVKSLLTLFACALLGFNVQAQNNPDQLFFNAFTNQPMTFDVNSAQQVNIINANNCSAIPISASGNIHTIEFTPNLDFTGLADLQVQYFKSIPFPPFLRAEFIEVFVTVDNGIVTTLDAYIKLDSSNAYTIFPLLNDTSTAPGLRLQDIAQVQSGSISSLDSQSFQYNVLDPSVELDKIIYISTDDIGTKGKGFVYLAREEVNPSATGELSFTISNTETQIIKLPTEGFSIAGSSPQHGSLSDELLGMVWSYTPSTNGAEVDTFTMSNSAGVSRDVIVYIKDYSHIQLAMDDDVYTATNSAVTFDAFANDNIVGNVILDWHSTELVHDSAGIFTYTPPTDFIGVKTFAYILDNGFGLHEAEVEIYIGNIAPRTDIDYRFSTPKNTALVLNYKVPLEDYSLAVLQSPNSGFADAYDENTIVSVDCQDITGKAFIVYSPNQNFVGTDSLHIQYCTPNGDCQDYHFEVEVYENSDPNCTRCQLDCVWEGDTNQDGRVSVRDILPIAKAMGYGGEIRSNINYGHWEAQSAQDWDMSLEDGSNLKHIDTNGDGFITDDDLDEVDARYNDVHELVPTDVLAFKEFPFYLVPHSTEVDSGDLMVVDIMLGTPSAEVEDLHGFAFGISVNSGFVDSASMKLEFFEDSWFAGNGNILQMTQTPRDGRFEAAVAKSNGNNANGFGLVAQLSFIIEDVAEGFKDSGLSTTRQIKLFTEDVIIEDKFGKQFKLQDDQANVTLNLKRDKKALSNDDLVLYPSPASDLLNIHLNGGRLFSKVEVFDVLGQRILSNASDTGNHKTLPVGDLTSGIYIVQVQTSEGMISKSFMKK